MKFQSKGIYLLPNGITILSLFFGFKCIIDCLNHDYIQASHDIFYSLILDGLDGRIARLTNTQTSFGAELDSLADIVSFGLAPGVLIYLYAFESSGRLGLVASFLLTAMTALRLARFNTNYSTLDKRFFEGLPCPSSAAFIASFVWVLEVHHINLPFKEFIFSVLAIALSLGMISSIPFLSFKVFDRSKIPLYGLMLAIIGFGLVILHPPLAILLVFFTYIFIQPFVLFFKKLKKGRLKNTKKNLD